MCDWLRTVILGLAVLMGSLPVHAGEISREQIKGLDEQVQEIKTDVLDIAAQLNLLEEKLVYPSNTQVSLFVSLADNETFRLDAVDVRLGDTPVAHHIYTFKELDALRKGGVQRIYTGNIRSGEHALHVSFVGKSGAGEDLRQAATFRIHKEVGPEIVEISLAARDITFRDR